MEREIILETAASYQDKDGILILTPKRLQWNAQGEKSPTIDIAILEIKSNFMTFREDLLRYKYYLIITKILFQIFNIRFVRWKAKCSRRKI